MVDEDHSYYGNGCPNDWGDDGSNGSRTSCATRIVPTHLNVEYQKNGTYYTYFAATSGSGGSALETDNANTPDTFCPLGWQLPYGGTGGDYYDKSRSWRYLVNEYSLGDDTAGTDGMTSYPLDLILSGYYYVLTSRLYSQGGFGRVWTNTIRRKYDAYRFTTGYGYVHIGFESTGKNMGYALRCDYENGSLNSFPWHPRKTLNILGFIKLLNEPEME